MTPHACAAIRELQAITNKKCATCQPKPYACCEPAFCQGVAAGLRATGRPVPASGSHPTLPFMGSTGCVIPAELRPGCSGFVCGEHVNRDRAFRRQKERLEARAFGDADISEMIAAAAETSIRAVAREIQMEKRS